MKTILIVFYLSFCLNSVFAQEIFMGEYCTTDHYSKLCIEFSDDSTFSFYSSEYYGISKCGEGHYTLIKDTLSLFFNRIVNANKRVDVKEQTCVGKDSIDIDVFVFSIVTKESIRFAQIEIWKNTDGGGKEFVKGAVSNIDGAINVTIAKTTSDIWMEVRFVGFMMDSIALSASHCQKVSVGLIESWVEAIEGSVYKYIVKKSNEKQLILLNLETGYSELLKKQ